jgi:arylsulfatase A
MDASDLLPTFADIAGAKLPTKNVLDGRSLLPQLLGKKGNPRDWIFIELE